MLQLTTNGNLEYDRPIERFITVDWTHDMVPSNLSVIIKQF